MTKKYTVIRKDIAVKAEIGHTVNVQIPALELNNHITRALRVVHVGLCGTVMNLLNDNDTIMYTVRVKTGTPHYTIQSIGQLYEKEITCTSGDHGIHIVMGQLSVSCIERRLPVEAGVILRGMVTDTEHEVRFVEDDVIVIKSLTTGEIVAHSGPIMAVQNYKGLRYE